MSSLPEPASRWDEPLLRAVAALQTQCLSLDEGSELLTELADMQVHRRIRSDLDEYIAAHARAGNIPANPLAELRSRLHRLARFFSAATDLHSTRVARHSHFLVNDLPAVSLAEMRQGQLDLDQAAAEFPADTQGIARQLSALDWAEGTDPDIYPELLTCAVGSGLDLPSMAVTRRDLRLLALGRGDLFEQALGHFRNVRAKLALLTETHPRHSEALGQVSVQIALGNYRAAERKLMEASIDQSAFRGFSDLDYATVISALATLKQTADEAALFAKDLPEACSRIRQLLGSLPARRVRTSDCDNAERQLIARSQDFARHWARTTSLPGSELEMDSRPLLEAVQPELSRTKAALEAVAAARMRSKRRLQVVAAVIVLAVLIALLWGLGAYRQHVAYEARERAAIEARAKAERIAAEAATERAAAEAWAVAERVFTEAAAERAAAEAKTERDVAEARAERAVAETRKAAERQRAEAAIELANAESEAKTTAERASQAKLVAERVGSGANSSISGASAGKVEPTASIATNETSVPVEGQPWLIPNLGIQLLPVAAGSFMMGSNHSGLSETEHPITSVTLSRPFWLGKTAITQIQYEAVMGNNPSNFKGPSRPVEKVSWNNATEFCRRLTQQERAAGRLPNSSVYTLPTEAQREYACRAGASPESTGDFDAISWHGSIFGSTHPVGEKRPNDWGFYDMQGNVYEWCEDWCGAYPGGSVTDPKGPPSGSARVIRGGAWNCPATFCRSTFRYKGDPDTRKLNIGFRIALSSIP